MKNKKHREQVADLILTDQNGQDLEICSELSSENGQMFFEIGNFKTKEKYRVTVKITELP